MQPPQNPYNQPGFGQQPQQPFNPQQPYGAPSPGQPRGTVSLDVIGESWNLVKASLGPWIVAMLLGGVALFLVSLVTQLVQKPFLPSAGHGLGAGFWLVSLVTTVISIGINSVIIASLIRMAISQTRTGTASFNEMFGITQVAGSVLVAGLLTGLVTYIGFILCIIPGVIASLGLAMTQPVIIDQNLAPVDAMKRSWEVMKPHLGSLFVLNLMLGLVNILGALLCGLGLFVTVPMSIVSIALVYRDLFGAGGSSPQNTGYTPPPIANPNF